MEARGALPPKLRGLKEELAQLRLSEAAERAPSKGKAA
jgi:ribosomal protein L29